LGLLGSDPSFHQAVRDALAFLANKHVRYPMIQEAVMDPIFESALGAARGAKRVIDTPQPRGCDIEKHKCSLIERRYSMTRLLSEAQERYI